MSEERKNLHLSGIGLLRPSDIGGERARGVNTISAAKVVRWYLEVERRSGPVPSCCTRIASWFRAARKPGSRNWRGRSNF